MFHLIDLEYGMLMIFAQIHETRVLSERWASRSITLGEPIVIPDHPSRPALPTLLDVKEVCGHRVMC